MSATSQPFGLRPAYSPSGVVRPAAYSIASGYAVDIFGNQPVALNATGTLIVPATTTAVLTTATRLIGTFSGVEYTDVDGRRRVSNRWPANTVGTDIVAYVTVDPSIVYEIQSSGAPLPITAIGKQYNISAPSGNAVVGYSTQTLVSTANFANGQLRVINITPGPDNAFGDAFVIVQVQISGHQMVADLAAF